LAAAALAARWLKRTRDAAGRLRQGSDGDALHDFRTSLRRLRVLLSSYRGPLGRAATKTVRRRLKLLARSTNAARDAEVWAQWLRGRPGARRATEAAALTKLRVHCEAARGRHKKRLLSHTLKRVYKIADELKRRLARVRGSKRRYGGEAARAIAKAARQMDRRFNVVRRGGAERDAHVARIRVKRLRYLLEPFAARNSRARRIVVALQELQALLGELHDRHGLAAHIGRPAQAEADRLERTLRQAWLRPGLDRRLIADALAFSRALKSR